MGRPEVTRPHHVPENVGVQQYSGVMANRSERGALVALLQDRPDGATWRQLTDDVVDRGSAIEVYQHRVPSDLFGDESHAKRYEQAAALIDEWEAEGIGVHTLFDDTFPAQLRDVLHMPPLVFTRGTVEPDTRSVAIVGSRKATTDGLHNATRLATGLAERGFTIVSGGAAGIDSAAHEAALAAGARTVAVIGTGVCRYYPPENRDLHDRVAASGMILSQFMPDASPSKASFPMRNAIMSGYVTATVVVEAGERSGTRIQARNAVEHGRPVLLAEGVLKANKWAQAMEGKPGVHAVTGLHDVLGILDKADDSDAAVQQLMRAVLS